MRQALILMKGLPAGHLIEEEPQKRYMFQYFEGYSGPAISLSMPVMDKPYEYQGFPSFFDGLLPEGEMLEGLLRQRKLDRKDLFGQLLSVGGDLVGAVTVEAVE